MKMAKKKGVFGKKISFRITAQCSAGAQAAAAAAAPPPPGAGGLRNSPNNSSKKTKMTPGLQPTNLSTAPPLPHPPGGRHSPKKSSSTTTAPQPPPFPPELRDSRKNSPSATTTLAPSTSLPGDLSPQPQPQPQPLPLASTSSSPSGIALICLHRQVALLPSSTTVEDEGTVQSRPMLTGDESIDSAPLKLLASKRTYPSPDGCQMLNNAGVSESQFFHRITLQVPNDGVEAKEKDEGANIGMDRNRDGLLEVNSQEPSKIKDHITKCDCQDWDEETEENDQVSLKLLASNSKRIYLQPPIDCPAHLPESLTEVVKRKSYGKTGSSYSQQNGIPSHSAKDSIKCCCHSHPMSRLDQFLLNRELTKIIELPGTSRSCRVTSSARLEIRLILRRSIRLIYKLHKEGYCLEGSFGLGSFLVDHNLFVTLGYKEEDRKNYSKQGACKDLQRFVKMVESEIFGCEDKPSEIMRWLSLIQKGGIDYEYLVSYDCALMEHNQVLSTFMQLYSKLQTMEKSDNIGYKFVLDQLNHFHGWSRRDLHNDYFNETFFGLDKEKRKRRDRGRWKRTYGSDVMSMLRLIRNTFQHIALKRIDKSGNIIFDEEDYEYILHDQFPKLLAELMEAMYVAAYLADLNLEHVMV